jgi:ribonuclease-3 family protein
MEESLNGKMVENPYQYSPLALAYIGDSVLDLMVKNYFVTTSNKQPYKYHRDVTAIVKAVNQAQFADGFYDSFSEEESDVYKRGRNTSTHSKAKNASLAEYKKATGLEAVLGFLYLSGKNDRLKEIVDLMIADYMGQ